MSTGITAGARPRWSDALPAEFITLKDIQESPAPVLFPIPASSYLFSKKMRQLLPTESVESHYNHAFSDVSIQAKCILAKFQQVFLKTMSATDRLPEKEIPGSSYTLWPDLPLIQKWLFPHTRKLRRSGEGAVIATLYTNESICRARLHEIKGVHEEMLHDLKRDIVSEITKIVYSRLHIRDIYAKETRLLSEAPKNTLYFLPEREECITSIIGGQAPHVYPLRFDEKSQVVSVNNKQYRESMYTTTSHGPRAINEDRTVYIPLPQWNGAVYGVFDGHDGATDYLQKETTSFDCVNYAITHLGQFLNEELERHKDSSKELQVANALTQTFLRLQEGWVQLYDDHIDKGETSAVPYRGGSTATVVLRIDSVIYCANLGDSRALLSQGESYYQLSRDMKITARPFAQQLAERDAPIICQSPQDKNPRLDGMLAMAGALGDVTIRGMLHRPELSRVPLDSLDNALIFLVSDGVTDTLDSDQIVAFRNAGMNPGNLQELGPNMLREAYHRKSEDNATVMAVHFKAE